MRRRGLFFTFALTFIALLFTYIGIRIAEGRAWVWLPLGVSFGSVLWLLLVHLPRGHVASNIFTKSIVRLGYLSMGFLSFLLVTTLVRDLVIFYLPYSAATAVIAALVMLAVGFANAWHVRLVHIDVPIENLPPALDGFRIAQISDLHIGIWIKKKFVEHVVHLVNSAQPDIVAITGDLVDGEPENLKGDIAPLKQLNAKDGCFYVTGNHEFYWGAEAWLEAIPGLGIKPLVNSHHVIMRGSAKLVVAGVPDAWVSHQFSNLKADPQAALAGSPEGATRVLLSHQPSTARLAEKANYHLQLSGHTHGGQFIPWTLFARLFHRFLKGLYRVERMQLYVNSGTGFWGPPVRLGTSPEITLLTLREISRH